jgi:hypothetical protein
MVQSNKVWILEWGELILVVHFTRFKRILKSIIFHIWILPLFFWDPYNNWMGLFTDELSKKSLYSQILNSKWNLKLKQP